MYVKNASCTQKFNNTSTVTAGGDRVTLNTYMHDRDQPIRHEYLRTC